MVQDNRLVQEFQQNGFRSDIGSVSTDPPDGSVSLSGLYGGIMPYRQGPGGGTTMDLSDNLVEVSGLATPGEPDDVNRHPVNRVIVFENEVHNVAQGVWHRQDETTGNWVTVAFFEGAHADYVNTGLYPIYNQVENKRYLVCAYARGTSGRDWQAVRYDPETKTVTSGAIYTSIFNSNNAINSSECQFQNNIYFHGHDEVTNYLTLNGNTLEIHNTSFPSQIITAGNAHRPAALCAYSGQVYMAYKDLNADSSGIISIASIVPTHKVVLRLPFEDFSDAPAGFGGNGDNRNGRCAFFVDNNPATYGTSNGLGQPNTPNIWLYYQTTPPVNPSGGGSVNVEGFSVWQIQGDGIGGLHVVQQRDSMIPQYYRAGFHENSIPINNQDEANISYCDNYPGWFISSPEPGFLTIRPFGGEPAQTFRQWDFDPKGGSTGAGGADIGGPTKVSTSEDNLGGGARWSPAAVSSTTGQDVNIFDIAYASGKIVGPNRWRIYYDLMPSTAYHAGSQVNVRWYYDPYHAPNKRCELLATSHGSLSGNVVSNVVMQSGVSYYVDWDIGAANLQMGDGVYLCGLAYTDSADIGSL